MLSSRERCASRASQQVYGVSDEEDHQQEDEEEDKLQAPVIRHRPSSPDRLRKTISGALDITEDVGLIAVGTPNLSKIWHHAYRREIAHEDISRPSSPFLRSRSPTGRTSPVRSRASSHLSMYTVFLIVNVIFSN